jgi:hypothetical protein
MSQFSDITREKEIEHNVIQAYLNKVEIVS